uniref:Uncharacterized protein n=1 Tax=Podarcis muralis TaxID=64176 RepID=A0A670II39_PODMU
MGCASAKHVSAVQNEEEAQKGKSYQNGDVFGDEYRIKPVEEVKYMKNGGEDDQKIAARNQENLVRVEHYYLLKGVEWAFVFSRFASVILFGS